VVVLLSLFTTFTRLGGDKSMMRFIPEFEDQPRKRQVALTLAYATALFVSTVVAVLIYAFAPLISSVTLDNQLFTEVLRVAAVVLPFQTLSAITYAVFRAIERMDYNVAASSVGEPAFRLLFVGGAVVLGYSLTGAAAGLIVSGVVTFVFAFWIFIEKTNLGLVKTPTAGEAKTYYNFSAPLTLTQLGNFLYNRVDILMIGFLLSGSAVGIYNVAVLLSGLLSLPRTGFGQLLPSVASRLYHQGDHEQLQSVYTTVTRLVFTVSLIPALVLVIYAPELLRVFGEEFVRGQFVLILFVVAQLTNALAGLSGIVLIMADHQYLTLTNQVVAGVLNASLNYVLILRYGFIGAAVATAIVLVGISFIRIVELWYFERIWPYNRSFIKPTIAGLVAAISMSLSKLVFQDYHLLIVGCLVGSSSFAIALYTLGIENEDIRLVRQLLR
jgi:O-antigen/teichoic acid export membrane protein